MLQSCSTKIVPLVTPKGMGFLWVLSLDNLDFAAFGGSKGRGAETSLIQKKRVAVGIQSNCRPADYDQFLQDALFI